RDNSLRIRAKPLVRQSHSLVSGQRSDRFWQLVCARHTRFTEQYRDYALLLFEGGLYFDPYEVLRVVQPSADCVTRIKPPLADYCEYQIALRDLLFQDPHEVETGRNAVHIHEQLLAAESLPQSVEQATGEPIILAAAVVDEYLAGHAPRPCQKVVRAV